MNSAVEYDFGQSNEELLDACKHQDQEALRVLFRRHERPVYNLLLRMLSKHEDAEDALAEVFVKVWRSAAGFKGDSKFTTWLYRIASNTARDHLRSRQVRPEVSIEDVIVNEAGLGDSNLGNPERTAIEAEDKARIIKAMLELSEEDRLLVNLYHLQECDYDEISQITGITPGNLKVRLFRARQRLRKICAGEEVEYNGQDMRPDTTGSSGLQQRTAESA
ncbi:MAG: sigma-70 family RNA polymerase sigma factor [Armatimonadota bacterium]